MFEQVGAGSVQVFPPGNDVRVVGGNEDVKVVIPIQVAELADAGVNVYASNGVSDGKGSYGYVIYVRPEEYDEAAAAVMAIDVGTGRAAGTFRSASFSASSSY